MSGSQVSVSGCCGINRRTFLSDVGMGFTGLALIAGGTGLLVPPTARLAATLSGVMIFLWVLMLHIPRALSGPNNANETAGVFEALAMSGIALMVAGSPAGVKRDTPGSSRAS